MKRKCDCGAHGGTCRECRAQRRSSDVGQFDGMSSLPSVREVGDVHLNGQPNAQDFTRLRLSVAREVFDGSDDEEGAESTNAPPQAGKGGPTQPAPAARPSGTKVDTVTDFNQAALQAGFLSGMGIIARMQVLPDGTTWDGKEVVESVQQTSSTCPDTLTRPGPCNGHSHFPIGGAMRGRGVRPAQPATRNRFYDIHTSESLNLSFLHDAERNPKGLNACETVCQQDYSFDGAVVGSHSIRRQFRKGTFGGHDVTIIDVTKTDLAPAATGGQAQPAPTGQGSAAPPPTTGGGGK